MKKKILFDKLNGIMHGGDYNPDQWLDRPDILEKDIELFKKAGINCVTLGVFSWSMYEPVEGEFHFEWLKEIMDNLYNNGIYTILATPSGARPAWLDFKYEEAMRVDEYGHRFHHGLRHNHCLQSPIMREKTKIIDTKLAENFADHPGMLLWHISNEFGGECFCPHCTKKFQEYLAEKFDHDIEKLNKAWWTGFWSHRYNNFEQIEPPFSNGESSVLALNLEWRRFTSWSITDFMKFEIEAVRAVKADVPVTTNFMKLYDGIDYHEMGQFVDYVSWDSYPQFHNDRETFAETMLENAFDHCAIRSVKPDQPFMLMESAPGVVNWHEINKYQRPGVHRIFSLQALASGADTVQYFQMRKSRGCTEQYHGAVIDHLGTDDTRVFKEVAEVGGILKDVSEIVGTVQDNKVALLFDWDNRWAIKDAWTLNKEDKKYEETCMNIWKAMMKLGVEADIVSSDMDWSKYKVIVAPMLYVLHDGVGDKIKKFVSEGGRFLATYFTGYVDKNLLCHLGGFPGDGLAEVFGIISEEIDVFYPTDRNAIRFAEGNRVAEAIDYAEMLRVKEAKILATYEQDYVQDMAAYTCKQYGEGLAYYIACRLQAKDMQELLKDILKEAGIAMKNIPETIEYHVRYGENESYEFYLNMSGEHRVVRDVEGYDLITQTQVDGTLELDGYCGAILRK